MMQKTKSIKPVFISGIGTGIGKTVVAAIVTEALNGNEFSIGLAKKLKATMILVSCNCLDSINHLLMTAKIYAAKKILVAAWVLNKHYLHYEDDITAWSGFDIIAKIPERKNITNKFIRAQANALKEKLISRL